MHDKDSKGISYTAGFFMLIAFAIACMFLASVVSIPIWEKYTGLNKSAILTGGMMDPANATALRIIQVLTALIGFLLPSLLTASLLNKRPAHLLGFTGKIEFTQVGLAVLIMASALLVSSSLSYVMYQIPVPETWRLSFVKMEDEYTKQVQAIINLKNPRDFILSLVMMAFLPALCEEALFRGGLQNLLSRGTGKPWFAIIVVSILFSLAHSSYYGFLSRFFLGVVLGAIYYYSGRLWLSILAHFLNNAVALAFLYFYSVNGAKPVEEVMRDDNLNPWGLLILPIVFLLFLAFKKLSVFQKRTEHTSYGF